MQFTAVQLLLLVAATGTFSLPGKPISESFQQIWFPKTFSGIDSCVVSLFYATCQSSKCSSIWARPECESQRETSFRTYSIGYETSDKDFETTACKKANTKWTDYEKHIDTTTTNAERKESTNKAWTNTNTTPLHPMKRHIFGQIAASHRYVQQLDKEIPVERWNAAQPQVQELYKLYPQEIRDLRMSQDGKQRIPNAAQKNFEDSLKSLYTVETAVDRETIMKGARLDPHAKQGAL